MAKVSQGLTFISNKHKFIRRAIEHAVERREERANRNDEQLGFIEEEPDAKQLLNHQNRMNHTTERVIMTKKIDQIKTDNNQPTP